MIATIAGAISPLAYGQAAAGPSSGKAASSLSEKDVKELLVWNSPWEGRATGPTESYSYRTTFVMRRDELVAQVVRYATNERGDSVVSIREGRAHWQDPAGAEVSVAVEGVGELVGTATSRSTNYSVVFKPRK